jgi:hypothetical protein
MKFCCLALTGVFLLTIFNAAEVTALNTAQVSYDEQRRNSRELASDDALKQVLMRVSGSE